jgi:hypothetical protein
MLAYAADTPATTREEAAAGFTVRHFSRTLIEEELRLEEKASSDEAMDAGEDWAPSVKEERRQLEQEDHAAPEEEEDDDDTAMDEQGADFDERPRVEDNAVGGADDDTDDAPEVKDDDDEETPAQKDDVSNDDPSDDEEDPSEDPWFPKAAERMQRKAPPVANGPQPGAAAARTRLSPNDPLVRNALKLEVQRGNGRKGLFRGRKRAKDGFDARNVPAEGATDTMKAHQVRTKEYDERRQKILQHIQKRKGVKVRNKVEEKWNSRTVQRQQGQVAPERLPFQKIVGAPKFGERIPLYKRMIKLSPEEQLMLDTTLSFLHGIKFGLFRDSATLSLEQRGVLSSWLQLLTAALPQEWGLHEAIDDLQIRMSYISKGKQNLAAVLEKHSPKRPFWSPSCQGKDGFNCGFWKLLHTITVGIAEHKGGLTLIEEGALKADARIFSPMQAADTIRDYMKHFFLCPKCGSHFVEQYNDCDNQRRCLRLAGDSDTTTEADWKELAKWLWEFHNSVNVRVQHEKVDASRKAIQAKRFNPESGPGKASQYDEIAVLWPTVDACIKCFDIEGVWNEDAVFLHLEAAYWPGLEPDPKMDRMLRYDQELDPTGSGLTMFLAVLGLILLIVMRRSLTKQNLQQTVIMAKSMRMAGVVQKRSE